MDLLLETQHRLPGGIIRFHEYAPSASLRASIACFWTYAFGCATPPPYLHRVLPDGCVDFIFILHTGSPAAVVIGPMLRSRLVISHPNRDIGVRFFPAAAFTLLGHPLAGLQDQVVPLEKFWDADARRLLDQLLDTRGFAQRITVIEDRLLARLRRPASLDRHVAQAVKWTYAERGRLSVRELARTVGLCERQLRRKFPVWTGYTPKQFVRVMRFQHALESMTHAPAIRDTDVAAMHGYADQSHMIREFCELGGGSPRTFQRNPRLTREKCPIFSIPAPGTLRYHREP